MEAQRPCRVAVVLSELIDDGKHELAQAVIHAVYDRHQVSGDVSRKLRALPEPLDINERTIRRHRGSECDFCRRKRALHENA